MNYIDVWTLLDGIKITCRTSHAPLANSINEALGLAKDLVLVQMYKEAFQNAPPAKGMCTVGKDEFCRFCDQHKIEGYFTSPLEYKVVYEPENEK